MGQATLDPLDKATLRGNIRAARRRRRAEGTGPDREGARLAAAALAHLDGCPRAADRGWGTAAASVAVFRSTPTEPDTTHLIAALHERGARVLVPRTLPDMSLDWHDLHPRHLGGTVGRGHGGGDVGRTAVGDGGGGSATATPAATNPASTDVESSSVPGERSADLPTTSDTDDEGPSLGVDAIADVTAMILPGIAVDTAGRRLGQGGGCYDRTLPRIRGEACLAVLLFDEEVVADVPADPHDRPVPAVLTPLRGWHDLGPSTRA